MFTARLYRVACADALGIGHYTKVHSHATLIFIASIPTCALNRFGFSIAFPTGFTMGSLLRELLSVSGEISIALTIHSLDPSLFTHLISLDRTAFYEPC